MKESRSSHALAAIRHEFPQSAIDPKPAVQNPAAPSTVGALAMVASSDVHDDHMPPGLVLSNQGQVNRPGTSVEATALGITVRVETWTRARGAERGAYRSRLLPSSTLKL